MSPCAIGIDIGGTNIKAGLVGSDGTMLRHEAVATNAASGRSSLLQKLIRLLDAYVSESVNSGRQVLGIGIGTAGYVNRQGVVAEATGNLPGWTGIDLAAELAGHFDVPVAVDNDVKAMAAGELWLGAGRSLNDFLCVTLGTGVGGSLIIGKSVYHGRDGFAGGFGHHVIVGNGLPCTCGLRGCWEQYASVKALLRIAAQAGIGTDEAEMSPKRVFELARAGDEKVIEVIEAYAEYVALGLANLIHILNPPAIIVGGAITEQGDFLFDRIRRHIAKLTLRAYVTPEIPIVPAELGDMAGVFGAASLVISSIR
ncbi:hypothetical protein SD70_27575 [Gordoniibacillus kamchatkensis]|uniref:ROK family protein n=1 Tax=Gordoniibacillus kamchatkensis TaxID=1590651 RepID=A0ABR5AB07_9BACL|nr:ROK family protein [Paenibacillus sp. VKM B-2647]KIL38246.1 hypothetical protein SD70_27575 [Paenibacillus sp. VKM B-2647]